MRNLGIPIIFLFLFQLPLWAQDHGPCRHLVKQALHYTRGPYQPAHWHGSTGIRAKAIVILRDYLYPFPAINLLNPLPINYLPSPTGKIFRHLWNNPHFVPSEMQWKILQRYHLEEVFRQRQEFLTTHPSWHRQRKLLQKSLDFLRWTSMAMGGLLVYQQLQSEMITVQELLAESKWQLAPDQIQLINETVPFPHTAIRIGNKVYSYGQRHLTAKSVQEYLGMRKLEPLFRERYRQNLAQTAQDNTHSLDYGKIIRQLGLDRLPQSLQIITLNLTTGQVGSLQRYLELQLAKEYFNVTFVNDCTTMSLRALELHTDFVFSRFMDASPAQMTMYFATLLMLKDPRVSAITQVTLRADYNHWQHLARNTYINILESRLFLELAWFNQLYRAWLDFTVKEREWYNPEVLAVMKEWEKAVDSELAAEPQIQMMQEKLLRLTGDQERCANFIFLVNNAFTTQINFWQQQAASLQTDGKTIRFNQLHLKQLQKFQQEWLTAIHDQCLGVH